MIAKSLFAAAALATTLAVALPASQAQAGVDVKIGIGIGGFYPGYYGHPTYRHPGAVSCWKGRQIVDNSGFNKVKTVDCGLPTYRFTAWRNGHKFVVKMNRHGNITNVNRIF